MLVDAHRDSHHAQPKEGRRAEAGTRGNPDNAPYIGKSDPKDNPVRLTRPTGHVSFHSKNKVPPCTLPDPTYSLAATRSPSADMFIQSRPEILRFYRNESYVAVPDNAARVTWELTETDDNARKGTAVTRRVVGQMGDKLNGPRMTLTFHTPAKCQRPRPDAT